MSNDQFEQYIRKAAEEHDRRVDVPDPDWDDLQQRIDQYDAGSNASPKSNLKNIVTAGAVAAAVIGAAVFFAYDREEVSSASDQITENREEVTRPSDHDDSENYSSEKESLTETGSDEAEQQNARVNSDAGAESEPINETPETDSETADVASGSDRESKGYQADNDDTDANEQPSGKETEKVDQTEKASEVSFAVNAEDVCTGHSLEIIAQGVENYEIIADDGEFINGTLTFYEPGIKTVFAQYEIKGEQFTDVITEVNVREQPAAGFTSETKLVDGGRPKYEFESNTGGHTGSKWMINGEEFASGEKAERFLLKKGEYEVVQAVASEYGCKDTAVHNVTVRNDYNLLAPDAFTPNGDGINDTWIPVALNESVYEFELEVYDMNKNLVFKTSDPRNEWKGPESFNPSNPREANFIWKAVVRYKGQTEKYGGTVRVLP